MSDPQAPQPRRRSSGLFLILALMAVVGSAGGVAFWMLTQSGPPAAADNSGFDIAVAEGPRVSEGPSPIQQQQSSLGMVSAGMPGMQMGAAGVAPDQQAQSAGSSTAGPTTSFKEFVLAAEKKVYALALSYTKKYPSVERYGKDWMKHPDLAKLNADYLKDRDPAKFLKGLARSESFPKLVKQYAGDHALQSFVKDAVAQSPAGLTSVAGDLVQSDPSVKKLVSNVTGALGLPPAMTAMVLGGEQKVDSQAIMGQVMGASGVQQQLANPQVQKALAGNEQAQQILKGNIPGQAAQKKKP